ncbi:aldo/keto reductase [Mycolicibacterium goodii]|uniref:Aldo/keto reductase n=1 Tax=Mycolicibacterium goodii TaxID=134601 RepID=A0A0K0X7K9_MYCGD|nr:aldo/keto reductase [Mycolicibacterium goodii]
MTLDSYVTLGRSGLRVSPFALGAMTFGEDFGAVGSSVEDSERILSAYLDRGGNFIDTANLYTNGHSEKILGDFFARTPGRRQHVVLASKFFANMFPGDPNGGGAGRSSILHQLHDTLRRLQTDYLDVYWLHNWDRNTPIEETMRTLDDLVRAGTVRYIGFSNTPAWVTAQAQTMAMLRGWTPLIALQVEYSLLARTVESELVPFAQDQGIALVPWSPLKNGFLSGKYRRGGDGAANSARVEFTGAGPTDSDYDVIEAVAGIAKELGTTSAAVALAWLRARPATVVPIIGARRLEHLESNLEALGVELTPEQLDLLDEISTPVLSYPATLNGQMRATLQFAGTTVDGERSTVFRALLASAARY